ncbi:MAG: HypC/HybG/HupF family hydrogenase formation chaperone [Solirubrobacteraceae bacterium]
MTCGSEHCITCSDEGNPMLVEVVDADRGLALCVGEDGGKSSVEIALIDAVCPGDTLLVHAGTALLRIEAVAA